MAEQQANDLITQLQAEVLALQEAAVAEALAVAQATAAAAQAATVATQVAVQQANATTVQQGAAVPPGPAAVPQGAAGVPPGPVFTLAPALANTATFLDLTTSSGAKHFKGAIGSLNSHPFDFEDGADLQVFLFLRSPKSGAGTTSLTFRLWIPRPASVRHGTSSTITVWFPSLLLGPMMP
jgi:hypothetical protein